MYDPTAPSSVLVAAQLESASVRENLVRIAFWSTKNRVAAQDLVHDGLVRVLDRDDMPWDPDKSTFLTHMTYVMRGIWRDRLRLHSEQEVPDDRLARDETIPSPYPEPDEVLDSERSRGIVEMLVEKLRTVLGEKRPRAGQCLDLMGLDCETPADQAARLACPVEEVYVEHVYIRRQAERIRDEWEASEKKRMDGLRRGSMARRSGS